MKKKTIETIKTAIETIIPKGIKPTQAAIAKEANLSIRTVKRHWDDVKEHISKTINALPVNLIQ